jgi:hypothetical protein
LVADGVGSAEGAKILIRVHGPSADPDDDELIEAKELQYLGGLPCLETPPTVQPALRVIAGARQVGRLKHDVLAAGPELVIPEVVVRGRHCATGGFAAGTGPTVSSASTISAPCRSWKRSSTTPACNLAVAL